MSGPLLIGGGQPMGMPQQTQLVVAAPMNDIQLVAQIAGTIYAARPDEGVNGAVRLAQDIVAEALRTNQVFGRRLQELSRG